MTWNPDKFLAPTTDIWMYKLQPPTTGYTDGQTLIAPLYMGKEWNGSDSYSGLVLGQGHVRLSDLKVVSWFNNGKISKAEIVFSKHWFKENEDLGDIIKAHHR